ncbi:MAG: V-type ATP synthase subunit I [Haloferacaceae archaeon]
MLRPERMSKVSVTGSKRVMADVIEATHELNLLHVTEYDGSWAGFEPGDPERRAEDASDKLVTVRSLESILDVDEGDAGPGRRVLDDEKLEAELADVRDRVNELDDRRDELRDEIRAVEEELEALEPFTRLGIDLDLLSGYRNLAVAVGEGDADAVERALADSGAFGAVEVFEGDGDVLAAFAHPVDGADDEALSDALVGVEFAAFDVPDAEGSPGEYVAELEQRKATLEGKLDTVEEQLDDVKAEAAEFILAAEEALSIEVQKAEAPLSFATTANAFVAEGWLPSERYDEFAAHVTDAVDGRVDVERLQEASFGSDGTEKLREELPDEGAGGAGGGGRGQPTATDGGEPDAGRAATDGGTNVVMRNDDPPVVQDNPGVMEPFELFVRAVGRPKYTEFDPTVVLFLTFPVLFGFMIGDFGYGLLYTAIGYYLYTRFDSPGFRSMGGVTVAAGLFTMLFGVLYGEVFGTHQITALVWGGHPPIEKGLQPGALIWAQAWLVISLLVGLVHLNVGYVFDFLENLEFHDLKHAVTESGSWILMMNGLWIWVFSRPQGVKPAFLYTVFDGTGAAPGIGSEAAFHLAFNGFPAAVGFAGAGAFALGLVLLVVGEPVEVVEFLQVLVNVLSYTRIAAVLLAKAGMAFTVNLLFFGAYQHHGEFHFIYDTHHAMEVLGCESLAGCEGVMFGGLLHGSIAMILVGLLVLVLGHLLVLTLGVTSAGLQAVRLEYVEFFGKFFEGGGKSYQPFGTERKYTAEE